MNDIGHNLPPGMIDTAAEVAGAVRRWLEDHPVIEDIDTAREAKVQSDRIKLCGKDLEDERKRKVEPLNTEVKEINNSYKPSQVLIGAILNEVGRRLTDFLAKEEAKRIKAAEEARCVAEAAERAAREAEAVEKQAIDDASEGVVTDVVGATAEADERFKEYQKASRRADVAEKDSRVKLGGGIGRALSLRNKETLVVVNLTEAVGRIGLTPDIEAAIIKGARAYRSIYGELPNGVESTVERSV